MDIGVKLADAWLPLLLVAGTAALILWRLRRRRPEPGRHAIVGTSPYADALADQELADRLDDESPRVALEIAEDAGWTAPRERRL